MVKPLTMADSDFHYDSLKAALKEAGDVINEQQATIYRLQNQLDLVELSLPANKHYEWSNPVIAFV